jgi:hypothetical protein
MPPQNQIDFVQGLRFVWDDPGWIRKLGLLTLFGLLSCGLIGIPFAMGYYYRLLRRSARGETPPMPEWNDLGGLFVDGLRSGAFHLAHVAVVASPLIVVAITVGLLGAAARALDPDHWSETFEHEPLVGLLVLFFYLTVFALWLALALYLPAARARFAATDNMAAGFDVSANLAFIRRNLSNYLIAFALLIVAQLLHNAGYVLCCVGIIPATFWVGLVMAWAEGQVVRLDPAFR